MAEAPATPEVLETPATPETPPATVTLSKEDHDRLLSDKARSDARATEAQRRGDRLEQAPRTGQGQGRFNPPSPATPPPANGDVEAVAAEQAEIVRQGLMVIAIDPEFRELLDSDSTLRSMLTANPLGLLPMLAKDAVDADDAIALVKENLASRKAALKTSTTTPTPQPVTPPTPASPGVNIASVDKDEAYEKARSNPHTEQALAGMIKAKMAQRGK